uniref:Purple acid phosphatase n=2 Tax=Lygus hesperus TaxID=30085 RepID=A0A146LZU8_LYGHE
MITMLMKTALFISFCAIFRPSLASVRDPVRPEQVHISYGESELEIVVTWSTMSPTPTPTVEYSLQGYQQTATGSTKVFIDGGDEKRKQYIHRVTLTDLKPDSKYQYRCGSVERWSIEFWFKTRPSSGWSPKLVVLGDMGSVNAVSLPTLQMRTREGSYDAVIHVGDIAYDLADENGRVGDNYMNQIQPVAAYVPYMVCPGNHERHYNFSHFRERFTMPGSSENLYYSFNMGPVHFVSVNTEAYWFLEFGFKLIVKQFNWLLRDLEEANENRSERPWIVLYGHRPMYCSGISPECWQDAPTRSGLNKMFGLEKVLHDYGVDVVFWGHQHYYERLFPIYDNVVRNGSVDEPYLNPKAPVHIITGAGGSDDLLEPFSPVAIPSSAVRNLNYGYTEVHFLNSTHLSLKQVATDANNTIVDEVMIVKNAHGPYK